MKQNGNIIAVPVPEKAVDFKMSLLGHNLIYYIPFGGRHEASLPGKCEFMATQEQKRRILISAGLVDLSSKNNIDDNYEIFLQSLCADKGTHALLIKID